MTGHSDSAGGGVGVGARGSVSFSVSDWVSLSVIRASADTPLSVHLHLAVRAFLL